MFYHWDYEVENLYEDADMKSYNTASDHQLLSKDSADLASRS